MRHHHKQSSARTRRYHLTRRPLPTTWTTATNKRYVPTSACAGCAEGQACPLFISAAKDFRDGFGRPCPTTRPAAENLDHLNAGVVAFEDPPGVAGDGVPSGGRYPANGVMTYYSGNPNGSWLETCTMPPGQKDLCTATLNYFTETYGAR